MIEPAPSGYQLRVIGPAARALAGRLPEKIAAAVYRVHHQIDEEARIVTVMAIDHRLKVAGTAGARRCSAAAQPRSAQ